MLTNNPRPQPGIQDAGNTSRILVFLGIFRFRSRKNHLQAEVFPARKSLISDIPGFLAADWVHSLTFLTMYYQEYRIFLQPLSKRFEPAGSATFNFPDPQFSQIRILPLMLSTKHHYFNEFLQQPQQQTKSLGNKNTEVQLNVNIHKFKKNFDQFF